MSNKKFESRRNMARKHRRTQRTWLFLGLGGLFLIGAAFLVLRGNQKPQTLAAIEVQGAPSFKVDKEQVDLGDVALGQTVQVSFQVTNAGDQPLRFSADP